MADKTIVQVKATKGTRYMINVMRVRNSEDTSVYLEKLVKKDYEKQLKKDT